MLRGDISNSPAIALVIDLPLLLLPPEGRVARWVNYFGRRLHIWSLAYRGYRISQEGSAILYKIAEKGFTVFLLCDEPDGAEDALRDKLRNEWYARLFFVHTPGQYLRIVQMYVIYAAFGNLMSTRWNAHHADVKDCDEWGTVLNGAMRA